MPKKSTYPARTYSTACYTNIFSMKKNNTWTLSFEYDIVLNILNMEFKFKMNYLETLVSLLFILFKIPKPWWYIYVPSPQDKVM